ncbi:gdsl esterase/lipase [Quercus suber]|uniref:Gdsl esterase/lipase n=1 Tax=Quercus suber TaxID=58331 RepID=A0AAW0IKV1_QUESU
MLDLFESKNKRKKKKEKREVDLFVSLLDMESHTLYAIFGLIISLALLPNPTISTKCSFPTIFNFGASNADTGGYSALFGQVPPPNGETYFHNPSGWICDGRLVIDFIAFEENNFQGSFVRKALDLIDDLFSHL